MALIHLFRDGKTCIQEGDVAAGIHFDVAVFTEMLHGDADAGFCIFKLARNIDGADHTVSFLQNKYRFEIVFRRFQNFHGDGFLSFRHLAVNVCLIQYTIQKEFLQEEFFC